MPYKPKLYIISSLTATNDGALVQATVTVPFPSMQVNAFGGYPGTQQMLHLKQLQVEIGHEDATTMNTDLDHYIITITPNSEAAHPVITDNDCLFKTAFMVMDNGTAGDSKIYSLIKKFKLYDVYINKSQFYIQMSLDSGGGLVYFKLEYEVINVGQGNAGYEQSRRGYTTS